MDRQREIQKDVTAGILGEQTLRTNSNLLTREVRSRHTNDVGRKRTKKNIFSKTEREQEVGTLKELC